MKRLNLFLILAALCLVLVACGSKKDDKIEEGKTDTTPNTSGEIEIKDYYHVCEGTVSKLPNVKGIEYTKTSTEIKETDIDTYVLEMLKKYPNYTEDKSKENETVVKGDTICLNYKGSLDGKEFAGGAAQGAFLTIGSNSFVGTFEEQMIGHKKNDSFTIDVQFPDQYSSNPDLAGKVTQFEIQINYIAKADEEPTDAWISATTNGTYKTVTDYRNYLREEMEAQAEENAKDKAYGDIIDYLKNNSVYETAEADVTWYYDYLYDQLATYASYYGITEETMAQYAGYESLDKFKEECKVNAQSMADEYTILQEVAKQENITVDDETYKSYLKDYMESAGMDDEAKFVESYGKDYLNYIMLMDEVWDYLYTNGTPVEKPVTEEAKTEAPKTEEPKTEAKTATEE